MKVLHVFSKSFLHIQLFDLPKPATEQRFSLLWIINCPSIHFLSSGMTEVCHYTMLFLGCNFICVYVCMFTCVVQMWVPIHARKVRGQLWGVLFFHPYSLKPGSHWTCCWPGSQQAQAILSLLHTVLGLQWMPSHAWLFFFFWVQRIWTDILMLHLQALLLRNRLPSSQPINSIELVCYSFCVSGIHSVDHSSFTTSVFNSAK